MSVIKVGDAKIRRVEEMTISSSMALLTKDQALIDANKDWLIPSFMSADGKRDFVFQSWIMIVDSKVFVIDPCTGNDRPHMYPFFNMLKTPYIERFAATGIKADEVDYVFCTHLHHDHCVRRVLPSSLPMDTPWDTPCCMCLLSPRTRISLATCSITRSRFSIQSSICPGATICKWQ